VFGTSAYEAKRVSLGGEAPAALIGPFPDWFSDVAARGRQPVIIAKTAIWEWPENGGAWRRLAELDGKGGDRVFRAGTMLRTGQLLTTVQTNAGLRVAALDADGRRRWVDGLEGFVRDPVPPNGIVIRTDERLEIAELDFESMRVIGRRSLRVGAPPTSGLAIGGNAAAYFFLQRGTGKRLVLVDRTGRSSPVPAEPAEYQSPRLSPDGRRVALGSAVVDGFALSISGAAAPS
jgi:hypothetical protein